MRRFIGFWMLGWIALVAVDLVVGWGAPAEVKGWDLFLGLFYLVLGPAVVLTWHLSDRAVSRMSEKTLLWTLAAVVVVLCLGAFLGNSIAVVICILVATGAVVANLHRVITSGLTHDRPTLSAEQRDEVEARSAAFDHVAHSMKGAFQLGEHGVARAERPSGQPASPRK